MHGIPCAASSIAGRIDVSGPISGTTRRGGTALALLVACAVVPTATATSGTLRITEDTTLGADHFGQIVIAADDVTLSCAGHAVRGPGSGPPYHGIVLDGTTGVTVRNCRVERFETRSADGTVIHGFFTFPPDATPGARLPAILRIHGGPTSQYSTAFEFQWQILAAQGYLVIAPNPRGSTGYGLDFSRAIFADWGNKDTQDVLAAVDHAVAKGLADPERLGVGGWSYGGMLTNYVITRSTRFKAAVSGASISN